MNVDGESKKVRLYMQRTSIYSEMLDREVNLLKGNLWIIQMLLSPFEHQS